MGGRPLQFRAQRGNLITWCERKTRSAFAAPLKINTAIKTGEALQAVLGTLPPEARKAISFDNGTEFALHQDLTAALGTEALFCDPNSPWQRGTIKNTNVIFRRDMPRKTDLSNYSARDIADLAWAINSTPS
ncbi:MAG: IS30 family transposase [Alphaproteobacteria bacterium]|nr:IS30 family transposase [Alphaproteobacteria bacterium]